MSDRDENAMPSGSPPSPVPQGHSTGEAVGETAPSTVSEDGQAGRKRRRRIGLLLLLAASLSVFAVITALYLLQRKPIDTIIPNITAEDMPHYAFSIYGAAQPIGVAVSSSGDRLYVSESGGERLVRVFDAKGNPVGALKPPASKVGHVPVYLAIDPQSADVYVSDRPTGSVYVFDRNGAFRRAFVPARPIEGWQPVGLAFSPQGDLWVTDLGAPFHRIEVFARDGTLKQTIGTEGTFSYPNDIAFDGRGNAFVSDSNNGRVVVIDPAGSVVASILRGSGAGNLGLPRGTALDDTGRLFVVDAMAQTVQVYRVAATATPRPAYLGGFGGEGVGDGQFQFPNGVAVDARARIYVTDRENNRVQVWTW